MCAPCGEAGELSVRPSATSLLTEWARTGPAPSSTKSSSRRTRITGPRKSCTNPLEPGKGAKVSRPGHGYGRVGPEDPGCAMTHAALGIEGARVPHGCHRRAAPRLRRPGGGGRAHLRLAEDD